MNQISLWNSSALAFEFKQFNYYFYKLFKSFLKLNFLLLNFLLDVFFASPRLYKSISPNSQREVVETRFNDGNLKQRQGRY
jgi:hypothetical protein